MLVNLHVKNLALLDEADIDFQEGLNILTGETGAGKSLLIGSVQLALGGKVPKNLTAGADVTAYVELTFAVTQAQTIEKLARLGVEPEDGCIVVSRKIPPAGRSVCRINGETHSASSVREVSSLLLGLHGQHEHESLLVRGNHLKFLDAYAKDALKEPKEALREAYDACRRLRGQFDALCTDEAQRNRQISFLEFEIGEIRDAALQPGEDERLEADYRRLLNGQKIVSAVSVCAALCAQEDSSASDLIGRALRELQTAAPYDETIQELTEQLSQIESLLGDFSIDLADYMQGLDVSEEVFAQTEERLNEVNRLKARYGKTLPDIEKALADKEAELEELQNYEMRMAQLKKDLRQAEETLAEKAACVSRIRQEQAAVFAKEVGQSLADLNFLQVRFDVEFGRRDESGPDGFDEVRFLICTNPGEPLRPLDEVASGGELSRIMLALKTILAKNDEIDTLIFDEIDAGISGRTAQKVAEKLRTAAGSHQIICITHLPQIASMADAHFLIEKSTEETDGDSRTQSRISLLTEEESVRELARMLGGAKITESVLGNAREMKELANKLKRRSV